MRLQVIDALASRADAHDGQVRRLLDQRLCALIEACSDDIGSMPIAQGSGVQHATPRTAAPGALGGLLDHLAAAKLSLGSAGMAEDAAWTPQVFPELPALAEFRSTWAKVRSDSQLRQSLEQVSEDAGPLNSGVLVHRAVTLMRTLSPGYLQQFLSYLDSLSWMEQMQGSGVLATSEAPRTTSRKPARNRSRKRSD